MSASKLGDAIPSLGGQKGDTGQSGGKATAGDQQSGKPEQAVSLPIEKPPAKLEAAESSQQAQTEQPSPYDLRDLNAQEEMAFWAMWMFVAAVATFFITSLGTFLIWGQVKLTRKAVDDTGKATRAMEAQNILAQKANDVAAHQLEIAKETFEVQTRPYITYDGIDVALAENMTMKINGAVQTGLSGGQLAVKWRNVGSGIATKVHMGSGLGILGANDPDPVDVPEFGEPQDIPMAMPPNSERKADAVTIVGENWGKFCRGEIKFLFYGKAIYYGFSPEKKFETEFCLIFTANGSWVDDTGGERPKTHGRTILAERNRMS